MDISTKTGDKGETGLFGRQRVSKGHDLIDLLGELDELQARLGLAKFSNGVIKYHELLEKLQDDIYKTMGIVSGADGNQILEDDIEFLEIEMKKYEKNIEKLNEFIKPGKTERAAKLHLARTACRRAERRLVTCKEIENEWLLKYLNRLSDLLFVLAINDRI